VGQRDLPTKIEFENNRRIYYLYDAAGTKLRKYYYEDSRLMTTTDYSGPFVYTDHHPDHILTSEGRLKWDDHDSLFHPEYFIKDHLGNVRVVLTTNPNFTNPTIQVTDYYPFGLEFQDISISDNRNLYNSKELQTDAKLWWYDYGARFYDPAIGRFHSIDPLTYNAPGWSPYNAMWNNPIRYIDPDGRWAGDFIDENGRYLGNDGIDDSKVYVVKTTQTSFDSDVPSAGISKSEAKATEKFIRKNSGTTEAFQNNTMAYDNSVEIIGDADTRQAMVNIVNQDNGKGGTSDPNNREYGGVVRNGAVIESPMGPVGNPKTDPNASITHPDVRTGDITFHSHPSGQIVEGPGSGTVGGTTTTYQWGRAPSGHDVRNASGNEYVFSRGNGTVYIYNKSGVVATIPQIRYVTPKK